MSNDYWTELRSGLLVNENPEATPLPPVTEEMINTFEQQEAVRLPAGYIGFLKVFGPGELAWKYQIKAPGYPAQGEFVDLDEFNGNIHERIDSTGSLSGDLDQIRRMLFFCEVGGGEGTIGWDPHDVQNESRHEYGIYLVNGQGTIKVADTFQDFIEDVCLGNDNLNLPDWDEDELGTRRMFDPACDISHQ